MRQQHAPRRPDAPRGGGIQRPFDELALAEDDLRREAAEQQPVAAPQDIDHAPRHAEDRVGPLARAEQNVAARVVLQGHARREFMDQVRPAKRSDVK